MKRIAWIFTALSLATAGCSKKQEEAPKPEAKVVASAADQQAEAAKAAPLTEVPIVSSSPEAIAAFRQGRDLLDNIRTTEAIPLFEKAVSLDPNFVQAHAQLAQLAIGDAARAHQDQARKGASALPDGARLDVERVLALLDNDPAGARAACEKLAALAPTDRRPHECIAAIANQQLDFETAGAELEKAIAIAPDAPTLYNTLAYVRLAQRKYDDALAAIDKYVAAAPAEPNPHDSKGEILIAAGRHAEAEAEFQKALSIAPQFSFAWQGIAISRFLRKDWAGGRDALAKQKAAATDPRDKVGSDVLVSMSWLAAGKPDKALEGLDAAAKAAEAAQARGQFAFIPVQQSFVLIESGKGAAALAPLDVAATRLEALAKLRPADAANLNRALLLQRVYVAAKLGKPADAEQSLAALRTEAAKVPERRDAQSSVHLAAGLVASAKGDVPGAIAELQQCDGTDTMCKWQLSQLQDKSGDKAGAETTRQWLRDGATRDWLSVYVATKLPAKK